MKKILCIFIILLLLGCKFNKKETIVNEKTIVKVELTEEDYKNNKVDELGEIPIMMYHGIHNKKSNYVGGNIDKDGYQRTAEAFYNDLEFYYQNNYRMIRLIEFINGKIDVELGKSPIIITFDDGLENNIKVLGLDSNGEIIIDENSAVGILEKFKKKYPDYNVTATFFVNGGLFNQPEYNDKILKWLINNGYDVGNHTYTHPDFTKINATKTKMEVGKVYELLNKIIPEKYVNIVALPFGSPYKLNHKNMKYIFNTIYNEKEYNTIATLRVGWKSESSPFSKDFNAKFLKRIRAYDNNGAEFDIEMNFNLLNKNRYVSDGDIDKIVIPKSRLGDINDKYKEKIITY